MFTEKWQEADAFYLHKDLLFQTARVLNEYLDIRAERMVYVSLVRDIRFCQNTYLKPRIGARLLSAVIRYANDGSPDMLVCCNFTPNPLSGFTVGLPCAGTLKELLNSDEPRFGGSGVGNPRAIRTKRVPFGDYPYSAQLDLGPLSAAFFRFKHMKPRTNGAAAKDVGK